MDYREIIICACSAFICAPLMFLTIHAGVAQVMESTNYRIQSDSVNFGGGLATSTNYNLESTAGEVATGDASSASYNLKAGYQQMVSNTISMSTPDNVAMTPAIPGVGGGVSNGSTTVTVITDSPAGYQLSILAEQSPALQSGANTIADYAPSGVPDYAFNTGSSDSHFGYSPSGINVVSRFRDNGVDTCNTGSSETLLACWDGLDVVEETVAQSSAGNAPNGATTTIYFRVGIGSSVVQPEGTYTATTTLTAVSL